MGVEFAISPLSARVMRLIYIPRPVPTATLLLAKSDHQEIGVFLLMFELIVGMNEIQYFSCFILLFGASKIDSVSQDLLGI